MCTKDLTVISRLFTHNIRRAERFSNRALDQEPDAPPEKMLIRFAQAEIAVLGSGLYAVEADLQEYE